MRLLVCIKGYIGDAVMATPLLEALEAAGHEMSIYSNEIVSEVLRHGARPRPFVPTHRPQNAREVLCEAARLRRMRFDGAVLVNRSLRVAWTSALAGIPARVGHPTEIRGFLLTHRVPLDPADFVAKACADLARPFGAEADDFRPRLWVGRHEVARGREMLEDAHVGVQPGARFSDKQLRPEALENVVRKICHEGRKVALLGGPEEREVAEAFARRLRDYPVVNLVGRTSIRETIGMLCSLRVMIGGDTGLMHLAAGVGCPTVTAFGPTNPVRWGHAYPPHAVLRGPEGDISRVNPNEILRSARCVLDAH
jgi:heptosyltransferase II